MSDSLQLLATCFKGIGRSLLLSSIQISFMEENLSPTNQVHKNEMKQSDQIPRGEFTLDDLA